MMGNFEVQIHVRVLVLLSILRFAERPISMCSDLAFAIVVVMVRIVTALSSRIRICESEPGSYLSVRRTVFLELGGGY